MHDDTVSFKRILSDQCRLLCFRRTSSAIAGHQKPYLAFGLFVTWLAGIGRYWDNPRASLFQHLGLGSVAYVFCLAAVLWLVLLPLKPKNSSYQNILVFVSLTSLPALLYAIPVERFMPMADAQSANAWFLTTVAIWRVALLTVFLRRVAGLSGFAVLVARLLPIVVIIVMVAILNLERVVFNLMGGNTDPSGNDTAYSVVFFLSMLSIYAAPVLVIAYGYLVFHARSAGRTTD